MQLCAYGCVRAHKGQPAGPEKTQGLIDGASKKSTQDKFNGGLTDCYTIAYLPEEARVLLTGFCGTEAKEDGELVGEAKRITDAVANDHLKKCQTENAHFGEVAQTARLAAALQRWWSECCSPPDAAGQSSVLWLHQHAIGAKSIPDIAVQLSSADAVQFPVVFEACVGGLQDDKATQLAVHAHNALVAEQMQRAETGADAGEYRAGSVLGVLYSMAQHAYRAYLFAHTADGKVARVPVVDDTSFAQKPADGTVCLLGMLRAWLEYCQQHTERSDCLRSTSVGDGNQSFVSWDAGKKHVYKLYDFGHFGLDDLREVPHEIVSADSAFLAGCEYVVDLPKVKVGASVGGVATGC